MICPLESCKYSWKLCFQLILAFRVLHTPLRCRSSRLPGTVSRWATHFIHQLRGSVPYMPQCPCYHRPARELDGSPLVYKDQNHSSYHKQNIFKEFIRGIPGYLMDPRVRKKIQALHWNKVSGARARSSGTQPPFPITQGSQAHSPLCVSATSASLVSPWSVAFSSVCAWPLHPGLTRRFSAQSPREMAGASGANF